MNTLDLDSLSITSTLGCVFAALGSHPGRRFWLKDRDGRYLFANDLFAGDLGMTPSELVGRHTDDVWPDCADEIKRIDALVCYTRRDYAQHVEALRFPTGEVFDVAVSRSPVTDRDGELIGVAGYYDRVEEESCDCPCIGRRNEWQMTFTLMPDGMLRQWIDGVRAMGEEFST